MTDLTMETEEREGYLWPKGDIATFPTVKEELAETPAILALVQRKRVCVQAGGNAGLWPAHLAPHFEHLYTFEPDPLSFRCLVANVPHRNVTFLNAAVGAHHGLVDIDRWLGPENHGANRIATNAKAPKVPTLRIDDLNLLACDLIQLDIEGFELPALEGAESTILAHRPVVVVELRNHARRYGYDDQDVRRWLADRGYQRAWRKNFDEAYVPA